jgi:hypothetical protein
VQHGDLPAKFTYMAVLRTFLRHMRLPRSFQLHPDPWQSITSFRHLYIRLTCPNLEEFRLLSSYAVCLL